LDQKAAAAIVLDLDTVVASEANLTGKTVLGTNLD
jgi:hypothetical protein